MEVVDLSIEGDFDTIDAILGLEATCPKARIDFDCVGEPYLITKEGIYVTERSNMVSASAMSVVGYLELEASQSTIH